MLAYRLGLTFQADNGLKPMRRIVAVLLLVFGVGAAPAGQEVDLALVIATDVSYSVDPDEARFQREGAMAAFLNPDVVKAIQAGPLGRIAVAYIDFASIGSDKVIADWHVVSDKASADAFADVLAGKPTTRGVWTSITSGLLKAEQMLDTSGYRAMRRVIDVSGDGPNNDGPMIERVREKITGKGISINGLPIMTEADKFDPYYLPDLDKYYSGCVVGGPGAFIQVAHGFEDLARAVRRKLILEISDAGAPKDPLLIKVAAGGQVSNERPVYAKGCDIGERMRFGGSR